eukprot:651886-Hanusia_phi.AAC.3
MQRTTGLLALAPVSLVALGGLGGHGEALALTGGIVVLGLLEQALDRVDDLPCTSAPALRKAIAHDGDEVVALGEILGLVVLRSRVRNASSLLPLQYLVGRHAKGGAGRSAEGWAESIQCRGRGEGSSHGGLVEEHVSEEPSMKPSAHHGYDCHKAENN